MCEKCNGTGLARIDVGAPMGDGCIEGYCGCEYGVSLMEKEICFTCGSHISEVGKLLGIEGAKDKNCADCLGVEPT